MGLLDALYAMTPEAIYERGFKDGQSGKPRKYVQPAATRLYAYLKEYYNKGYDEGREDRFRTQGGQAHIYYDDDD